MRTAIPAASSANGAASRMIAMAAFMRSGYAIRARAILRILCRCDRRVRSKHTGRRRRTSASRNASVIAPVGTSARRDLPPDPQARRPWQSRAATPPARALPHHAAAADAVRDEPCNVVLTVNTRSKTGCCLFAGIVAATSTATLRRRRRRQRDPGRRLSSLRPSTIRRCSPSITWSNSWDSNRVIRLRRRPHSRSSRTRRSEWWT